ncbi:MAG: signal peptidase II [Microcoleaceae cyanobacterium]
MRFKRNPLFWIVALVSLVLDHLTKFWVVKNFALTFPPQTLPLLPGFFHFTYVVNTGAAFSLFNNGVNWLKWLSLFVSIGLIGLGLFGPRANRWEQVGYGFILGGALGNGIDRFFSGHVVDFLDFRVIQFPVFNLADVFINVGIFCLLIGTFPQKNKRNYPPTNSSE